jgi:hypothetical protein
MRLYALVAASALALSSTAAFAQTSPGGAADPSTNENVQPAPSTPTPNDPAAGSNPAAQQPTSPPGTGGSAAEGAGTGESGAAAPPANAPAGIPADPNTKENVQPGPSNMTPSDPSAGANPGARAPTAP